MSIKKIKLTKEQIIASIDKTGGNVKHASKILDVSRDIFYKFLKEYDLRGYLEESRIALRDKALEVVEENFDTDPSLAMKYLQFTKNLTGGITVTGDKEGFKIVVGNQEDKKDLDNFLKDNN